MIPRIDPNAQLAPAYQPFLAALKATEFTGDIEHVLAERIMMATDNSIYQLTPEIVLYPKTQADIMFALALAPHHPNVHFAPRGGGTGTDGQSLTDGIVIDCSKYMRKIIEVNAQEQWVRVESGVILDQLNDTLKTYGLYLPVNISTSNRATVGGMVNTDACGQGSLRFGRTSNHMLSCTVVLSDGSLFSTTQEDERGIHAVIEKILLEHTQLIHEKYPDIPRHATGYNLADIQEESALNLNYLIAGSEGTLGVVTEIVFKVMPIIKHKKLLLIRYPSFDAALKDAENLSHLQPAAIEVMDEMLAELIKTDALYPKIQHLMDDNSKTITLLEFQENTLEKLNEKLRQVQASLHMSFDLIEDPDVASALWQCRKKSVGLLGKSDSYKRPVPFVEDATVHPRDLAAYIRDFRAILDSYQLEYGMFGHADSGCIHVRPSLNLINTHDEALLLEISRKIFNLTRKYNGVLWGEHGLGFRSGYNPEFFGETLYHEFRKIKTLFDPGNQLNPGKVATPLGMKDTLYHINGPLRAHNDKLINVKYAKQFEKSTHCNGNGLCFNYQANEVMCPSYKATRDRKHSPKGRAALLRTWLTRLNTYNFKQKAPSSFFKRVMNNRSKQNDFSRDVFDALNSCLGCKACTSTCPINVSIPDMKSHFLYHYYQRYTRPVKDFIISKTESISAVAASAPFLSTIASKFTGHLVGLCDLPTFSKQRLKKLLPQSHISMEHLQKIKHEKSVLLLQDTLTSFYDNQIVVALERLLKKLGYTLYILPFKANGKAQHVLGFRDQFLRIAQKNIAFLQTLAHLEMPIIGIDPSITLSYRDEYKALGSFPQVLLLQEWLSTLNFRNSVEKNATYYLLPHCTEKTASLHYISAWQSVFESFNLTLEVLQVGCCGMAGAYGLDKRNRTTSQDIYNLSWAMPLKTLPHERILTTGFSCRCQVARFSGVRLKHPIELLAQNMPACPND